MKEQKERYNNSGSERGRKKRKKKKAKWGILSTFILLIAIAVFGFSLFQLSVNLLPYWQGRQENQQIQTLAIRTDAPPGVQQDEWHGIWIDFDQLLATNSDTVAWLQFENPDIINYPVVHSHDNEEYLNRSFTGEFRKLGSIFLDMYNTGTFLDRNSIIYGHRMSIGGEMFAQLGLYEDIEHVKQYPNFFIYTPDGLVRIYEVFATTIVDALAFQYQIEFVDDDEFAQYIARVQAEAKVHVEGVEVLPSDRIVTLSTCTPTGNHRERLIVQGVLREIRVNVPEQPSS